jgi:hypothetical protein
MGIVFLAHDTKLDRAVSLKFLPTHLTESEDAAQRLLVEAHGSRGLDDLELDDLTLPERREARALDGREMHEAIAFPVVRCDESEALLVVEPLHFAGENHTNSSFVAGPTQ